MKPLPSPSLPAPDLSAATPTQWLQELTRQFPLIMYSGLTMIMGAGVTLLLMLVDDRTVMGINTWIKPTKFLISVGVYLISMGWVFAQIQSWNPRRSRRLSRIMACLLNLEVALIVMQAARGVRSHYNVSSVFDALVFSSMGILIGLNTLIVIYVCWISWSKPLLLPSAMRWAIRLGLLVFIVASFEGSFMAEYGQHTIGAADGGEGIPFLNWAKNGGDLRIAHFFGVHSLQLFPLLAFVLRRRVNATEIVVIFAFLYSVLSIGAFAWAMMGRSL